MLLFLGRATFVFGVLTLCYGLGAVVAILLGITVCTMSGRDLKRMRAGLVDPAGEPLALGAWNWAVRGMLVTVAELLGLVVLCFFIAWVYRG
jgi:hypothetical protein